MQCAICGADAWYVCGRSGRPVCLQHARIEVVSRLSFGASDTLSVHEASPSDYEQIGNLAEKLWGTMTVTCFDSEYDVTKLPAYVASANGHLSGVLAYAEETEALVVARLDVLPGYQGLGAGKMLVEAAKTRAAETSKTCILACATNDDLPAIYFYQKNGFQIYEVRPGVVADRNGSLKVGFAGIPLRDEIHMRWEVGRP